MYVATFYSFKGGVGRSMALVNVAAEIARRGKRVLVVDFDLEAPGLDTFDITRSEMGRRGLLDFVCDFRAGLEVPDVREYVYQAQIDLGEGQLWVMPAGLQNEEYHNRFRSVDWADLYAMEHGFLLFEDLKAQWKDALEMDYVLIDSRTGHTDVGGICTRQLPNAVVALFFPNEQNRRGLLSIVSQIREEAKGPLKKKIDVHFVMSNVPDLDDEEEILENEVKRFEESLGFSGPNVVIHHYDSLALLEQVTFTIQRPRSRLAREYADLALTIVRKNLEDRLGALAFLDSVSRRPRTAPSIPDLEAELQRIRLRHSRDGEVLGRLAALRARQRKSEEALAILTQALDAGAREPELLLRRAQLSFSLGQKEQTVGDLREILDSVEATGFELAVVIRMLREIQPDLVQLISRSPALDRLEPDFDLIRELQTSPETLTFAVRLMSRWLTSLKDETQRDAIRNELSLCLIGRGSYKEALDLFGEDRIEPGKLQIPVIFNYAMALWGLDSAIPVEYLRRIAEWTGDYSESPDPNHLQCFSLVNHLVGNVDAAARLLARAREMNLSRRASSFSCWSYLIVSVERFACDLEEMGASFESGRVVPEFIRRTTQELPSGPRPPA